MTELVQKWLLSNKIELLGAILGIPNILSPSGRIIKLIRKYTDYWST